MDEKDERSKARVICDYISGMTDILYSCLQKTI
ncbi:MAG: hypothetical protein COZ46_06965 [Verrucomicrobia bacterium CG_4_10_14_3_um_filter_43_23]|nr:MAG: hypothetical protein COX01_01570 [Verrucomicrobia bacterium CG22_combo_CG10-13_8_21_14_all_43_17]PIX57841.1 MAG: hypothetical protein COZ46_06965 [Verrucomicrobia bacterium CG_4_10_14_3_um_filter_43_23]PIY63046.1 MAG: hypothetical protein COY94_00510 [Verrucomicrobia bacterium CG_4_10_14_0_8_um_filter_43_34]PJA43706.1 MAG: hypothetical protein CO175_06655 [Verrucomicrobia bacterium CG_4_9_14_3_um_filter_43_20]